MKRTSKRVMAVAVSLAMVLTGSTSALAATTNPEISDREIEHKTAAKNIAAQGMVLLENKNNSLPISKEKGTKIALFGAGRIQYHQRRYRFRCSKTSVITLPYSRALKMQAMISLILTL